MGARAPAMAGHDAQRSSRAGEHRSAPPLLLRYLEWRGAAAGGAGVEACARSEKEGRAIELPLPLQQLDARQFLGGVRAQVPSTDVRVRGKAFQR